MTALSVASGPSVLNRPSFFLLVDLSEPATLADAAALLSWTALQGANVSVVGIAAASTGPAGEQPAMAIVVPSAFSLSAAHCGCICVWCSVVAVQRERDRVCGRSGRTARE